MKGGKQRSARRGQLAFELGKTPKKKCGHGGKRRNSGRKPANGKRAGVPHRRRRVCSRLPMHITVKIHRELGYLPNHKRYREIHRALIEGCEKQGFRVVHYTVERDHIHLIVEASDAKRLRQGMTGLQVRIARKLNRLAGGRKGQVFVDRYHSRQMKTPLHTRNTLVYVLQNGKKHGRHHREAHQPSRRTTCSSADFFDGWKEPWVRPPPAGVPRPVAEPRTWLLREGWKKHGPISVYETPRS